MRLAIELVMLAAASAAAAPNLILLIQIFAAILPRSSNASRPDSSAGAQRVAVLMPAHDEEAGIGATLENLKPQLRDGDRLVVVADNCSDRTEHIARECGAEVVVRNDAMRVGKGYALAAGHRHLTATGGCDVLVILDADCAFRSGAVEHLRGACLRDGRPQQAVYLMQSPEPARLKARFGEFAWLVKNRVRPTGFARLGLPCQLFGSGMAFPFSGVSEQMLATGHIVEDMVIGAKLALAGTAPRFCEDAVVVSEFAASEAGREKQKTRWLHGHLLVIRDYAPALLLRGAVRGDLAAFAIGADLVVPPLTVLLAFDIMALAVGAAWFIASGSIAPFILSAVACLMAIVSLATAWWVWGRRLLRPRELLLLPSYLLMNARIVMKFLIGKRSGWTRSDRVKRR